MSTLYVRLRCLSQDRPAILAALAPFKPIDWFYLDDPPAPPFCEEQVALVIPYTTIKITFPSADAADIMRALKDTPLCNPFVTLSYSSDPDWPEVILKMDDSGQWHKLTP